jgi:hypothetical protein
VKLENTTVAMKNNKPAAMPARICRRPIAIAPAITIPNNNPIKILNIKSPLLKKYSITENTIIVYCFGIT